MATRKDKGAFRRRVAKEIHLAMRPSAKDRFINFVAPVVMPVMKPVFRRVIRQMAREAIRGGPRKR